jgi:hypothetical protein
LQRIEMAPAVLEHPGTRPTTTSRVKEATVDTNRVTHHDPEDTLEAHYSSLERLMPHGCYEGFVYIGHIVEDELDGEPVEVIERVPCRRCSAGTLSKA